MRIRVVQPSPSDDRDGRRPGQFCLPASSGSGKNPSVPMFNLLLSDCRCPRMLSFLPDRVKGLLKIRISERPYSDCDQLGALLGFPEDRSPAFGTEVECHSSTALCSTRVSFGDALSEPDLLSRIPCLNTESASRTPLAFEAVAHGDADGVASNCYLELSATACGFAIRHVDYLSTETRNSRNSIRASAQFLVSQDAGRERYVQQKGVSRLPAQLMEIAKSRLRELR